MAEDREDVLELSDGELRPTPTNVEGLIRYLKQVKASSYKKYPFINGAPTKKEAIAKLQAMLDKGIKVI